MKIIDTSFEYDMPNKAVQPRCDLKVYRIRRGQEFVSPRNTYVVVFAEPLGYEGVSVTNAAEHIITAAWTLPELRECDYTRAIFVEHYPAELRWRDEESFDLVTFDWEQTYRGIAACRPVWNRVTREWVEALVKERV